MLKTMLHTLKALDRPLSDEDRRNCDRMAAYQRKREIYEARAALVAKALEYNLADAPDEIREDAVARGLRILSEYAMDHDPVELAIDGAMMVAERRMRETS